MKSFQLTDTQYGHLIDMLESASVELGNRGCNDYDVANTDENWEMITTCLEDYEGDRPEGETLCTYDWMVCDFIIRLLKAQAEK